jgi:predicted AAA+ superfamily ATPase
LDIWLAAKCDLEQLHHWRCNGGAEVDFLLERDGMFFPIEVKAKSRPSRVDTTGLRAFRAAHPQLKIAKGLVVAPTEAMEQLSTDEYSLPWDVE